MSDSREWVLDRHVFASNASAFNSAWETYAWSPEIAGRRAGRLEERVPWAAELGEMDRPPVLTGAEAAWTEVGELPQAYLPLDGRLGFSVSGAIGAQVEDGVGRLWDNPDGKRPRTGTHTLLFAESVFPLVAGFPLGVMLPRGDEGEPAWVRDLRSMELVAPAEIPPVVWDRGATAPHLERARLQYLANLLRRAERTLGPEALERCVRSVYRALAEARAEGAKRFVVGRPEEDRSLSALLVRLLWLSLPIADRLTTFYSTTWLGGRMPEFCLTVATSDKRLRTLLDSGDAVLVPVAGDNEVSNSAGSDGIDAWIDLLLSDLRGYASTAVRADARRLSVFDQNFGSWMAAVAPWPLGRADLSERIQIERRGLGRMRGLGWLVGMDLRHRPVDQRGAALSLLMDDPNLLADTRFCDGVCRALTGSVEGVELARLAVAAGVGAGRRSSGLAIAVRGVHQLVIAGGGFGELAILIDNVRDRDGLAAASEMQRIGIEILRASGRLAELPDFVSTLGGEAFLSDTLEESLSAAGDHFAGEVLWKPDAPNAWPELMTSLWRATAGASERSGSDSVQRVAWQELVSSGQSTLARLSADGDPDVRRLVRSIVVEDPPPPLTLFLALRSSLVSAVGDGRWWGEGSNVA